MFFELEDRIFLLEKTILPEELSIKLKLAKKLYEEYNDVAAGFLVAVIENECKKNNIKIVIPRNVEMVC